MKKKIFITMAVVTLFTILLVGCTRAAPSHAPPPGPTTLPPAISRAPLSSPSVLAPPSASPSPDDNDSSSAVLQSALPLKVTEPANAATLTMDRVTVIGQTKPGATVNVNDESSTADSQGNFSIPIILEDGPYAIDVIAADDNGNQGEVLLLVNVNLSQAQAPLVPTNSTTPLNNETTGSIPLKIITPADGADVSTDTVAVKGQTVPNATVCVDDQVDIADSSGNFSIPIDLVAGVNAIDVIATDDNGDQSELILLVNNGNGS